MHQEFGIGEKKIIYYNIEQDEQVDILFNRFLNAYQMMYRLGYPEIRKIYYQNKVLFTSKVDYCRDAKLCICLDQRELGLYVSRQAYQKMIAERICSIAGIHVYHNSANHVSIGIGNKNNLNEVYLILKDSIIMLPSMV